MMVDDSRRYHRQRGPRHERYANWSSASSNPQVVNPFGKLPFRLAAGENVGFTRPLQQGFAPRGGGPGTPTQNFISQATPVLSNVIPSYSALGGQITAGANNAYNAYQGQIDAFLQQLPGFQASAGAATAGGQQALDYAGTAAKEAFSPLEGRALFQEAAQRALAAARPGMAARGALDTGAAGAQENKITSDLAFNALQNEQANRQAAIQGLGGAAGNLGQLVGNQAGIAGLGPQAAGALFQAYPQLAQMLTQATGMPLEGANQALQFLNATQNPAYSRLRMVLPQVAQTSQSTGYGILSSSDARVKRDIREDVPGLDVALKLRPVSFEYIEAMGQPGRRHGLIAQEVQPLVPSAVSPMGDLLGLDYAQLVPVLLAAIQQLAARVVVLEAAGKSE